MSLSLQKKGFRKTVASRHLNYRDLGINPFKSEMHSEQLHESYHMSDEARRLFITSAVKWNRIKANPLTSFMKACWWCKLKASCFTYRNNFLTAEKNARSKSDALHHLKIDDVDMCLEVWSSSPFQEAESHRNLFKTPISKCARKTCLNASVKLFPNLFPNYHLHFYRGMFLFVESRWS